MFIYSNYSFFTFSNNYLNRTLSLCFSVIFFFFFFFFITTHPYQATRALLRVGVTLGPFQMASFSFYWLPSSNPLSRKHDPKGFQITLPDKRVGGSTSRDVTFAMSGIELAIIRLRARLATTEPLLPIYEVHQVFIDR